MKAKLRRLEEESTKKDRQIEQLLDPVKVMSRPQQTQQQRWAGIVDISDYITYCGHELLSVNVACFTSLA